MNINTMYNKRFYSYRLNIKKGVYVMCPKGHEVGVFVDLHVTVQFEILDGIVGGGGGNHGVMVVTAFCQVLQRNMRFALTRSAFDAFVANDGSGFEVDDAADREVVCKGVKPVRVDLVIDVFDVAIVVEHFGKHVAVRKQAAFGDDNVAIVDVGVRLPLLQ